MAGFSACKAATWGAAGLGDAIYEVRTAVRTSATTAAAARRTPRRRYNGVGEGASGAATDVVYVSRTRSDLIAGGLGGAVKRKLAQSQAQKAAEDTLGVMRTALESAR